MLAFIRKNIVTVLIVIATVVLAGIALFTALRLYQLRQQRVAPTAPESRPAAQEATASPAPATANNCTLAFTLAAATSSPTASPTASPTPPPACNDTCTTNTGCPSTMICSSGKCRNSSCTSDTDCVCATATATASPTAAPELPEAGTSWPTLIGAGAGLIILLFALVLAI